MKTYTIFYTNDDGDGVMYSHCLANSIDWLYDNGYVVVAIRDMGTGKVYQNATNVRRVEND